MKKIILAILILLMASPTFAMFGGETINFTFDKCNYLTVNIAPSVIGEWTAQNCIEESAGNFFCVCNDNHILYLTPAVNAVGTYQITMTNYYGQEAQPTQFIQQVIYSGDWVQPNGRCQVDGCTPGYECIKNASSKWWGRCLRLETVVEKGNITNVTIIEPINITGETTMPAQPVITDYTAYVIAGVFIIIIFAIWYYFRRKHEEVLVQPEPHIVYTKKSKKVLK